MDNLETLVVMGTHITYVRSFKFCLLYLFAFVLIWLFLLSKYILILVIRV